MSDGFANNVNVFFYGYGYRPSQLSCLVTQCARDHFPCRGAVLFCWKKFVASVKSRLYELMYRVALKHHSSIFCFTYRQSFQFTVVAASLPIAISQNPLRTTTLFPTPLAKKTTSRGWPKPFHSSRWMHLLCPVNVLGTIFTLMGEFVRTSPYGLLDSD